ncbi:MAG: branched-chain amino acid ABC transporter permease [Alphaproteobacteria bacterium]|nr:branched-chain amino acid ABC transporter permease [Alphaproteobacteria bacterium]
MSSLPRPLFLFAGVVLAFTAVGFGQSWGVSLSIVNLCLISAVMALGLNMQWGYAGLINLGSMGFAALGGLAGVLVSKAPVAESWSVGGGNLGLSVLMVIATVIVALVGRRFMARGALRNIVTALIILVGYFLARAFFDPAVEAIESVDGAKTGYLGGAGMPIIFSWIVGGAFAGAAAWIIGKIALGLRTDYFAIATLGISEIILAVIKNEDWLSRGVKNVTGLSRPVPYEIDLQTSPWFLDLMTWLGGDPVSGSTIFVKLCYAVLFIGVLLILIWLLERALNSPWGRMMRAIRDNEHAAEAMGKNVTRRHLQIFVLGAAVVGVAGAMLTTLDGQFTPGSYNPLRFTFVIWVMVIVGGSGNNWGSVLGAFIIWFIWIEAEPAGLWLMNLVTTGLDESDPLRLHLLRSAPHMRVIVMGLVLLLVLRFSPKGLMPEVRRR